MAVPIAKNKREWRAMSADQREDYANSVFLYYREHGYPYYHFTPQQVQTELHYLRSVPYQSLIADDVIAQTMHGLALMWSYFPHAIKIVTSGRRSPYQNFMDDEVLHRVIRKRMQYGDYLNDSGLRKALRIYEGARQVSGFRPSAAAAIYRRYAPPGAVVWDMCAGFGGRLLGAALAGNVALYYGNDPATRTFNGLAQLAIDLKVQFPMQTALRKYGSEKPISLPPLDLAFTSPPYFDTERYSNEATQSYRRFPKYSKWREGFLRPMITQAADRLKPEGVLILNVANCRRARSLADDSVEIAFTLGFKLRETLQMALSGSPHKKGAKPNFKYEPVFIFTREGVQLEHYHTATQAKLID